MTDTLALYGASRIYFDTAPLIYWIEERPQYFPMVQPVFEAIGRGLKTGISSYITLLEVLVLPLRDRRFDLVSKYRNLLLSDPNVEVVTIERDVSESAARLRAKYSGLKSPDAIHLAAAQIRGADLFLTNDQRLNQITEVKIVSLSAASPA